MKNYFTKLITYIREKRVYILEIWNQYSFVISSVILLINLLNIIILFYIEAYFLSISIFMIYYLIFNYMSNIIFFWSEADYLGNKEELRKKNFWVFKNDHMLNLYFFSWFFVRTYLFILIIHYNFMPLSTYFLLLATIIFFSFFVTEMTLVNQFYKQYLKYYYKKK